MNLGSAISVIVRYGLCPGMGLQQFFNPSVVVDADARTSGYPAVEVDGNRCDGGVGGGRANLYGQAYGVAAGSCRA